MQLRTPSPNTQSGVSVKSKAVIYVLTKHFLPFNACFIAGRRAKKKKQSRRRRITPPRSGLVIMAVRLVFWNAEIQARTPVLSPSTLRSSRPAARRARWHVRVLHRRFIAGTFVAPTGTSSDSSLLREVGPCAPKCAGTSSQSRRSGPGWHNRTRCSRSQTTPRWRPPAVSP